MPGIPGPSTLTEDSAESLLSSARANAQQSLQDAMPGDQQFQPVNTSGFRGSASLNTPPANAPEQGMPTEPPPDAIDASQVIPSEPPPTATDPAVKPAPTTFQGTQSEVGNGVMRGLTALGRTMGFAAAVPAQAIDKLHGAVSGGLKTGAQDAVFGFLKDYVDTAYDHWHAEEPTGKGAQVIGHVSEIAPALLTGPAAAALLPAQAMTEAGKQSIDEGQDLKTAAMVSTAAALATYAGMKVIPTGGLLKRLAAGAGINVALSEAQQRLTRRILSSRGYKEAAARIDPNDPMTLGEAGLIGAIFGAISPKGSPKKGKPAEPAPEPLVPEPPPDATDPTSPTPPAAPDISPVPSPEGPAVAPVAPEIPAQAPPAAVEPVTPPSPEGVAPAAAVPDRASAEPLPDIQAQIADLHEPNTPRQAVYLSADNLSAIPPEAKAALTKGLVEIPNFDEKGGSLLVKDQAGAALAKNALAHAKAVYGPQPADIAAGRADDGGAMQTALGFLTDAGEGKRPDQTAVVQGQTPDGAVASEAMVRPDQVAARAAQMEAEGKTPVVTTPEAAIARREAGAQDTWSPTKFMGEERRRVQRDQEHARRSTDEKPPATEPAKERGVVKTGAGERAVFIDGPAKDGKVPVRLIDKDGEASEQVVHVPESSFVGKSVTESPPAKVSVTPEPANEPAKTAEVVEPARITDTSETKPTKESTPEKAVAKAVIDQLGDAMETLRSQEVPPAGKKFPASVKERAMNVANFARALKAVAAASDAPAEIKARAIAAAKAVERVDLKSDEALAKNQGVGHSELATHVENLLNAAELLRNPKADVPAPKAPKAEKLKARIAKPRTLEERQAGAKPHVEIVGKKKTELDELREKQQRDLDEVKSKVKVIEDVPDETKPKVLNKGEQLKLKAAGKRLIEADEADVDARSADIEKLLEEMYQGKMHPDDRKVMMYSILAERRDRLRRKTRDEEVEEEFSDVRHEQEHADTEADYALLRREETASGPEWAAMANSMEKGGTLKTLRDTAARRTGEGIKAPKMLRHMAAHTPAGPMRDFLTKLAAHVPEDTFIQPVDVVRKNDGSLKDNTGGQFTYDNKIQVRMGDNPIREMQTIVHEAVHAATAHLITKQPNHPFSREIGRLRDIAEARFRKAYGDELIDTHNNYFRGKGPKPAKYSSDVYGLMNSKEFMSEVMTNPVFQEVLAASEKFKQPGEGFIGGVHKLASAVFDAVKRMLGLSDKEGKLLSAAMRATEDVMEAQKRMFDNGDAMRLQDDMEILRSVDQDPKRIPGEELIRRMAGDKAADTTRQFYRAIRAKAVRAMRRTVLANETHDQIVRSNAHWFGDPNSDSNPLRQFDAAQNEKAEVTNRIIGRARESVVARNRLDRAEDRKLGQLQIDTTLWGIDPSKPKDKQTASVIAEKKFEQRWADFQKRWANLSPGAREVYLSERDFNQWSANQNRRVAIDAALDTFSDRDVSDAQRQLLYSVRGKQEYDSLIGPGKLIDVGDRNASLTDSLKELAGLQQKDGPYFHLGRHGDYVVQVEPEGSRDFATKAEAENFAAQVKEMGPGNKAKVAELGGKWNVATKIQYVSMHENSHQAETEADALRAAGYTVGHVTQKVLSKENAPLSSGIQQLVGEATRKLERRGSGDDTKALSDSLRATFVTMTAARSAYAASKLARRGFAGVKGEEMGRNFAAHAQSMSWNTGNLATVFKSGEALGRIREAAKNPDADVSQATVYKRGAVMDEIGKRMQQEVSQYGLGASPVNAVISKLGFLNFLASPAHAAINMTQNFTTAIPIALGRFGARSVPAFARSMRVVAGPSFRSAIEAHLPGKFTSEDIAKAVVKAVGTDPNMAKWVKGGQLQQLMDRGVIGSTFAHEISTMTHRRHNFTDTVFDYARILPQMAEVYNRVSTALAGLELTGGDVAKTADFIHESHLDYSQGNKSRTFKAFGRIPGGNAVLMFKTYVQGMAHLLYSNIKQMAMSETKSRAEAAKTVAALIVAQSLFAGVVKGAMLEPLRLGVYAYNKIFGDSDEYFNLDNSVRRAISAMVGPGAASDAISGGLPRLLGFDLSSRMGLSDLFLHNPPDLLQADTKQWMEFAGTMLGPMPQMVAQQKDNVMNAIGKGDTFGAMMSLVPVKAVQDMRRAFDLYSGGKKSTAGGQLTDPSILDATVQALGVKPATVARAQERGGTVFDYREFGNSRKQRLMKAYAASDDKSSMMEKIRAYNAKNPGNRISAQQFIKQARSARRGQVAVQGGPERDPNVRELLDY